MKGYEQRNSGNKILLAVIGATTFLTAMVGATFAYFSATHTSEKQEITTATASLNVTTTNNNVKDIRPIVWNDVEKEKDTNKEVVKIEVIVTGNSTADGQYSLYLNEPEITLNEINVSDNDDGSVDDFKWSAYTKEGTKLKDPTSFTGKKTKEGSTGVLIPNSEHNSYTKKYNANVPINDTYYIYVWAENSAKEQNKLQGVNFNVTFTAISTTKLADE